MSGGPWGLPLEILPTLPGYDTNLSQNRTEARQIMQILGFGPSNRIKLKGTTRDLQAYRVPSVLLIGQLAAIYINAELDAITPDPILDVFYGCGSSLDLDGYCDAETDRLIVGQSREPSPERRGAILATIERHLADDCGRNIIFYTKERAPAGVSMSKITAAMVNSLYNGNRRQDI